MAPLEELSVGIESEPLSLRINLISSGLRLKGRPQIIFLFTSNRRLFVFYQVRAVIVVKMAGKWVKRGEKIWIPRDLLRRQRQRPT